MNDQNLDEAQRWLQQARHDLDVARWNAKGKFWSDACFMAQQASEKALKAFCYAQGERHVVGHALLVLVRRCAKYDSRFEGVEPLCKQLDKYYVITRYPNGLPGLIPADYFDEDEADESLKAADAILLHVDQALAQTRPSGAHLEASCPQYEDELGKEQRPSEDVSSDT